MKNKIYTIEIVTDSEPTQNKTVEETIRFTLYTKHETELINLKAEINLHPLLPFKMILKRN